jgi:hypothetical protein
VTNLSEYKQSYTDALAHALRQTNIDFEFLKVYRKLIGTELSFGNTEYGVITHFKSVSIQRDETTYAVTNKGYEFECQELLYIIRLIELKAKGIEVVYPQGSDYAQNWTKPKQKRKAKVLDGSAFIHPSQFDYYTTKRK